ncbi:MAG: hypothetical protein KUL82_12000 [Bdellovibrio sp.]|nr:hypothetical protein [Bdellovibrio sp.]
MELSYRLIDMTSHRTDEEVRLVNTCFQHWYDIFSKDVEARGATLNEDEFHRARVLAVLQSEDAVVGFHLYSIFDLRELPSKRHSYLKGIPESAKSVIDERGSRSLMAMEYLTVCPDYRAEMIAGARAAELIVRLGLKVLNSLGLDAAIGVARVDRKVNSLADSIGCEEIMLMEKYNNKCSLMYFDRRIHVAKGNPFVMNMVETLWNQRNQGSRQDRVAA